VVFGKEYIMRCSSAEWIEWLEMMPSWCRQVDWGNCGIPWVNCAVLCMKDDWKGQFWGPALLPVKTAVYSVFPSGMTSRSKIAQFNWGSIGRFLLALNITYRKNTPLRWQIKSYLYLFVLHWWCTLIDQIWIVLDRASSDTLKRKSPYASPLTYTTATKGKAVPLQAWSSPEGSRKLRFPDFMTTAQDGGKVVSLKHRPSLPPGNAPGTHFS